MSDGITSSVWVIDLQLVKDLDHGRVQSLLGADVGKHAHLLGETGVEGLSNLLRFTDTTALDDDVVKLLQLGEADEFLEQVTTEGTANAAVLEGNDLFIGLCEVVGLLDQRSINVDTK